MIVIEKSKRIHKVRVRKDCQSKDSTLTDLLIDCFEANA